MEPRATLSSSPVPLRFRFGIFALTGLLAAIPHPLALAQAPSIPDWAQPGSATHVQVPPPAGFHRPSRTQEVPLGVFAGQTDVGGAVIPGDSRFAGGRYTVSSAGYNIWYTRDEFRYVWKRVSGDLSLAADVSFPAPNGYGDRKAVLIIRQSLEDDSKEAMIGEHGAGLVHLAERATNGGTMSDMQYRFGGTLAGVLPKRIGIEKHGDSVAIFISLTGEPMHQLGPPVTLHFDGPFYVGIGFCSHQPATVDTAIFANVLLSSSAGAAR